MSPSLGRVLALLGLFVLAMSTRGRAQDLCVGDCNHNGAVGVDELIVGVNIALDFEVLTRCPEFDTNADGDLRIAELLGGVRSSIEGCRSPDPTPTPTPEEFIAEPAHFECLTGWTRVRRFRIANPLGHLEEALAVARGEAAPPYPIGTIIQLVPAEAMVKRGAGFFPDANDWEFFVLDASAEGTVIRQRGREEVVNIGAPCFGCHNAATETDLICETGNGCIPLNLPEELINRIQDGDPRCAASPTPAP